MLPASKRPKGFKSVLKNRQLLNLVEHSELFQTPEPLILNDYWAYFPVPQKALFRDLLNLSPPPSPAAVHLTPMPTLSAMDLKQLEHFESEFSHIQQEYARAQVEITAIGNAPVSHLPHL
jgi:hypothetical protein